MKTWYNDNLPAAVDWLRALIARGAVSPGEVDGRSVEAIRPADVSEVTRAHFFAGIGGWDYALRLAGWPEFLPVWTASLPCQPFSVAGKLKGTNDERHLWPVFRNLVEQCHPPILLGEQVASPAGRSWFAAVQADLEILGYASAAFDLCAAGIGAPHPRQRLYWVAYSCRTGLEILSQQSTWQEFPPSERSGKDCRLGDSDSGGSRWPSGTLPGTKTAGDRERIKTGHQPNEPLAASLRCWEDFVFIPCADEKWRPIEPSLEPVAHGIPARVGRVRGYGNSIVPQVAATFARSVLEVFSISPPARCPQ